MTLDRRQPHPGPWAVPVESPGPRVAARQAPLAYAFVLGHPVATFAFTLWAIDGLLHCDDAARVTYHLGFGVHLVLPALVGAVVAVVVGLVGLLVRPRSKRRAWAWILLPTVLTWLTLWAALASTAEPGPAPWSDPPPTSRR